MTEDGVAVGSESPTAGKQSLRRSYTQENPKAASLTRSPRTRRSRSITLDILRDNNDLPTIGDNSKPRLPLPNKKRRSKATNKPATITEEENQDEGNRSPHNRRVSRGGPKKRSSSSRPLKTSNSSRSLGNKDELPDMDWTTVGSSDNNSNHKEGSSRSLGLNSGSSDSPPRTGSTDSAGEGHQNSAGESRKEKPDMDWSAHQSEFNQEIVATKATTSSRTTPPKEGMKKSLNSNSLSLQTGGSLSSASSVGKDMYRASSCRDMKGNKNSAASKLSRVPLMSPLLQIMAMDSSFHGVMPQAPALTLKKSKQVVKPSRDANKKHLGRTKATTKGTEAESFDKRSKDNDDVDFDAALEEGIYSTDNLDLDEDEEDRTERQRGHRAKQRTMKPHRTQTSDDSDLVQPKRGSAHQPARVQRPGKTEQALLSPMMSYTADDLTMRRRKRAQDLMSPGAPKTSGSIRMARAQSAAAVPTMNPIDRIDRVKRGSRLLSEDRAIHALVTPRRTSRKPTVAIPANLDLGYGDDYPFGEPQTPGRKDRKARSGSLGCLLTDDDDEGDEHDNAVMNQRERGNRNRTGRHQPRHSAKADSCTRSDVLDTPVTDSDYKDDTMNRGERSARTRRNHRALMADDPGDGEGRDMLDQSSSGRSRSRSLRESPVQSTTQQDRQTNKFQSLRSLKSMGEAKEPDDIDDSSVGSNRSQSSSRSGRYGYSGGERLCLSAVSSTPKKSVGLAALLYCSPLDLGGDDTEGDITNKDEEATLLENDTRGSAKSPVSVTAVNVPPEKPQADGEGQPVDKVQAKKDYWKAKLAGKAAEQAPTRRARRRNSLGF